MTPMWIHHALLLFLCLGVPALAMTSLLGVLRMREGKWATSVAVSFVAAVVTLLLYAASFANIPWQLSVMYLVFWPFPGDDAFFHRDCVCLLRP